MWWCDHSDLFKVCVVVVFDRSRLTSWGTLDRPWSWFHVSIPFRVCERGFGKLTVRWGMICLFLFPSPGSFLDADNTSSSPDSAPDCVARDSLSLSKQLPTEWDIFGFCDAGPRQSLFGEQSEMMSDSGLYRQPWGPGRATSARAPARHTRSRSVLQLACVTRFPPDACRLDSKEPAR
jgi:hypothetical protein